jgi:antitoxin component YwqK of YwqJK toxin-antitoxin module
MIKHVITNHPNFEIKTFKEYVNNVLVKECHYDDKGQLNGLFYENGSHHEKFHYINGKIVGLYQRWHPNGQLREQCTFNEKGNREGLSQTWYDNGQLREQFTYNSKSEKEGLYRQWYDNGELASVMQYYDGLLHGHYTSFKIDGSPMNSWFYQNGKKIND